MGRVGEHYDLTAVGVNPAADRSRRMRVYFIAMSVRIACVGSLFFVRGWWILLAGLAAVILPYFAVLVANQAEHRGGVGPEAPTPLELGDGGRGGDDGPDAGRAPTGEEGSAPPASEVLLVVDAPAERRSGGSAGSAPGDHAPSHPSPTSSAPDPEPGA